MTAPRLRSRLKHQSRQNNQNRQSPKSTVKSNTSKASVKSAVKIKAAKSAEKPAVRQRRKTAKAGSKAATAESMAAKQRDISVSEFFAKNRHLLGFDNPRKALLTTVKEAVDNSLDACEEAHIL